MHVPLNARVGRTVPAPWLGVLVALPANEPRARSSIGPRAFSLPRTAWLALALCVALWPHAVYIARRLVDGSDEPWGLLAIATVALLMFRDRAHLAEPTRSALVASGLVAIVAAVASLVLPDLVAAAIAMLAVGLFIVHALRRPATPMIALLLLALPVISSLQFYLGYPLRALTAVASAGLLGLMGIDVSAAGASLQWNSQTILVDAPCAGIGMLWVGSYTAALLSYLNRAGIQRTLVNAMAAALLVLVANIVRNTGLFFVEAHLVHWPPIAHDLVGLAAFVAAIVPIAALTAWKPR